MGEPLSAAELQAIDAYWHAANYLSAGQIYLLANPLLREAADLGAHQGRETDQERIPSGL